MNSKQKYPERIVWDNVLRISYYRNKKKKTKKLDSAPIKGND